MALPYHAATDINKMVRTLTPSVADDGNSLLKCMALTGHAST